MWLFLFASIALFVISAVLLFHTYKVRGEVLEEIAVLRGLREIVNGEVLELVEEDQGGD